MFHHFYSDVLTHQETTILKVFWQEGPLETPETRIKKTVFETVLSPQQMVVQWNIILLNFKRLSCYMHDNFNKCFIIYWNYGLIYQFCMNLIVSLGLSIMVFHWFRKGCDSWTDRASSWYPLGLKYISISVKHNLFHFSE